MTDPFSGHQYLWLLFTSDNVGDNSISDYNRILVLYIVELHKANGSNGPGCQILFNITKLSVSTASPTQPTDVGSFFVDSPLYVGF